MFRRIITTGRYAALMLILLPVMSSGTIHNITIGNNFFTPLGTITSPGDTIRWTWVGGIGHSTTSDVSSPVAWNSGIFNMANHTFDLVLVATDPAGPYPYHCIPHSPFMKDTIWLENLCYEDSDLDGYGSAGDPGTLSTTACGAGFSQNNFDCDDGDPSINPGAVEIVGDGLDQNCDGFDECYVDADLDGFGSNLTVTGSSLSCINPGESTNNIDCNDTDDAIFPNAIEVSCDNVDNDCNPATPDGADNDLDGVTDCTDCDDNDPTIFPGATEILDDGIDQDCDGFDATASCCGEFTSGFTGNADCDIEGKRNLADITRLIDRVYLSKVLLCCDLNGNINGDIEAKINLADITALIDHVYISKNQTAACP